MLISRRTFLTTVSASAVLAGIPGGAHTSLLSNFNNGKTQVNLAPLQTAGDYAFLNLLKTAQEWAYDGSRNAPVDPATLDTDGYPTSFPPEAGTTGVSTICNASSSRAVRGVIKMVVLWDGGGRIILSAPGITPDGPFVSKDSSINNRISFRCVASPTSFTTITVGIDRIGATSHVTNIRVFHAEDEAALNSGQIFGSKFKQRLMEANFGVIRFLDWQDGGTTNVTKWTDRKPLSHYTYAGKQSRSDYYCGIARRTGGGSYAVEAPEAWTGLVDKTTVIVKFPAGETLSSIPASFRRNSSQILMKSHGLSVNDRINFTGDRMPMNFLAGANYYVVLPIARDTLTVSGTKNGPAEIVGGLTAGSNVIGNPSVSLNVGGSGDINVVGAATSPLSTSFNSYPEGGTFRSIATFVFDATLNVWMKQGGDATGPCQGISNGVPPELMVRLCAEVGAHPWFVGHYLTLDPITDYTINLAQYCRDNGPGWMIPRFEGPNECWNSSGGYHSTIYGAAKAAAYGWGADNFNGWYGKVMSVLGQAISGVFSGNRSRYQIICGVWTHTGLNGGTSDSDERLSAASYVSQSEPAQLPYLKDHAFNWVTHVACTNYFSQLERFTARELINAYHFAVTFAGNQEQRSALVKSNVDTLVSPQWQVTVTNGDQNVAWPIPHNLKVGEGVVFFTLPPAGFVIGTEYYVRTVPTSTTASLGLGGSKATVTPSGTGVATLLKMADYNMAYNYASFTLWKRWASFFGVNNLTSYEGGYSPDYITGDWTSPISTASAENQCVLDLREAGNPELASVPGNCAVAGMPIRISGAGGTIGDVLNNSEASDVTVNQRSGIFTWKKGPHGFRANQPITFSGTMPNELIQGRPYYVQRPAGSTFAVSATKGGAVITTYTGEPELTGQSCWVVTGVAGTKVAIDLNTAGLDHNELSGTVTYINSAFYSNNFRAAGKLSPVLQTYLTDNYRTFVSAGGSFPSCYLLSSQNGGATGQVWAVLEDIYQMPDPPQWLAIVSFNRDTDQ